MEPSGHTDLDTEEQMDRRGQGLDTNYCQQTEQCCSVTEQYCSVAEQYCSVAEQYCSVTEQYCSVN